MYKKIRNAALFSLAASAMLLTTGCSETEKTDDASADKKKTPPAMIPMKDFFKNPEKASFRISPNGEYIAYRAPWENRMNVFVQKIGEDAATQVTHDTIRDVGGFMFKGDKILYSRDMNGDENFIVFSADIDGSGTRSLTPESNVRAGLLDGMHDIEGMEDHVLIQMNERNPQVFDPYLLNVNTGDYTAMYDNSADNFESWMTDHAGVIRIATKTEGTDNIIYLRASADDEFEEYMRTSFKDSWSPLLFTFDDQNLIVSHNMNGRDKNAIVEWNVADKKETKLIHEDKDNDVYSIDYSKKRKVLTTVSWTGAKSERIFLDKVTEDMYAKLAKNFEGYEYWVYGEDDSETKFLVWAGSDRKPGTYYAFNAETEELTELADTRPWLNEDDLAKMEPISYQSRDGLTIHGYLTLPIGREAKDLPVVVNPHGGPWARDQWGYNPEVQMLANRGYAVLQMNFRGSVGYGRSHWEASFKEWGKAMQNDITDGVNWLIEQGIADADRVAIYGASYGGYATLAGITFTPELYACAVDYVGVSNLFTFMETFPPYWKPYVEMMHEMVGDPAVDSLAMREASPVFHVDKIQCPLFIAQGANDQRVKKDESDQVVEALKARGVEVEYMVKDNEGHGFHNEENRFDFYGAMEKFLDQHIGEGAKVETEETAEAI